MTNLRRVPMTGGTRKLSPSLTQKLIERGVYNAEVARGNAEVRVELAAQKLRQLVRAVYTNDADLVLDNLRSAVDASGALDGEALTGLAAEADFYDKAASEIQGAVDARDKARAELDALLDSPGPAPAGHDLQVGWAVDDFDDAQDVLDKFKEIE